MEFSRLEEQFITSVYPKEIAQRLLSGHFQPKKPDVEDIPSGADGLQADALEAPGPNPVDLSAVLMLASAFDSEEAFLQSRKIGGLTIIDCPSPDWIAPLTRALARLLKPFGRVVSNPPPDYLATYHSAYHVLLSPWDADDGNFGSSAKKKKPTNVGDAQLLECMASRRPVYIFTAPGHVDLSAWARSLSHLSLSLPEPGLAVVSKLLHMLCRQSETTALPAFTDLSPSSIAIAFAASTDMATTLQRLTSVPSPRGADPFASGSGSLDDLIGMGPLKQWAQQLKADIAAVAAGTLKLTQLPKGLLLSGPPGTGKSKGAKIVAQHAGMTVVFGSVGRWLSVGEGHLGTFVSAMRSDFAKAAAGAPAMLIVDEIDAFPTRGKDDSHWFDAALTALLEAMDGLDTAVGVVTVGICNNPEGLDPALTRAGRFDHRIEIDAPGIEDLAKMFALCLRPDLQDADFTPLAVMTIGGTIADVDRICKDARRLARNAHRKVEMSDVKQVVLNGAIEDSQSDRDRTALHEAAHGLIAHLEGIEIRWISISVAGLGGNRGSVLTDLPRESWTLDRVHGMVRYVLAGHAAETLLLGGPSFGASADLQMATTLVTRAAASEGMMGTLIWRNSDRLSDIDRIPRLAATVESVLADQHKQVTRSLNANRTALHRLRDALIDRHYLDRAAVANLLSDIDITPLHVNAEEGAC